MKQLFSNNARTSIAATFSAASLTLELADASMMPQPGANEYFLLTLFRIIENQESGHEVVKVTARTGNSLTVQRSHEGAAASEFAIGSIAALRATADTLQRLQPGAMEATETSLGVVEKATTTEAENGIAGKFPDSAGVKVAITKQAIAKTSPTGSAVIPVGPDAGREAEPYPGLFRFNSETATFEGYDGVRWGEIGGGGGATGGGVNQVFVQNDQIVTDDYTIEEGKHAMSTGPITIAEGVTVTIPEGSNWVIL